MKKLLIIFSVMSFLCLGVAANTAFAGYTNTYFTCFGDASDFTCSGSFEGARNNTSTTDWVYFFSSTTGVDQFGAKYDSNSYYCTAPATMAAYWDKSISNRGRFYVRAESGTCSEIYVVNHSAYFQY